MRSGVATPSAVKRTLVGVVAAVLIVSACSPATSPSPVVATPGASGSAAPPAASGSAAPSAATGEPTRAETLIVKAYRAPDAQIGNQYIAASDALV